jgi:uncharacterized protein YcfL
MRKLSVLLVILVLFASLVGCQSKPDTTPIDEIETDGSQESILDSISQALKDIFD